MLFKRHQESTTSQQTTFRKTYDDMNKYFLKEKLLKLILCNFRRLHSCTYPSTW